MWRRSAIVSHRQSWPGSSCARPVQPPCAVCGMRSAPARHQHCDAVRSKAQVRAAGCNLSFIPAEGRLLASTSMGRCSEVVRVELHLLDEPRRIEVAGKALTPPLVSSCLLSFPLVSSRFLSLGGLDRIGSACAMARRTSLVSRPW